jgi:hypothetical protein
MTTAILGVLTLVLLTAGLTLHGRCLESRADPPQPDATQCRTELNHAFSAGGREFPGPEGRVVTSEVEVKVTSGNKKAIR